MTYDELNSLLLGLDSDSQAAEAHGVLLAMICAAGGAGLTQWRDQVATRAARDSDREASAALRAFCSAELAHLEEALSEVRLLLPDDDEPLGERGMALADWCQGFLYGLASVGVQDLDALPDDAREILYDVAAITRVGSDEEGEASEAAFAELVEYLRVGVQVVYEELADRRAAFMPAPAVQ